MTTSPLNIFFEALAEKNFCDVVFVFPKEDNKTITAHKVILSSACEVFKDMFLKDGKPVEWPERDNGMDVVPITDILHSCFEILINNIYDIEMYNDYFDQGKLAEVTWSEDLSMVDEMKSFQHMANKFKLPWLTQWSDYLIANHFRTSITIDNCLPRLSRSLEYDCLGSNPELISFIRKNRKSVLSLRKFTGVNLEALKHMFRNCYILSRHGDPSIDPLLIVNFVVAWAFDQCRLNSVPDSTANLKSFLDPLLHLIPLKDIPKITFDQNPFLGNLFSEKDRNLFRNSKVVDLPASVYCCVRIVFTENVRLLSVSNVGQNYVAFHDSSDNRELKIPRIYDPARSLYFCDPSVVLEANHEYIAYIHTFNATYTGFSCSACSSRVGVNFCNTCKSKGKENKCPCHEKIPVHQIDVKDSAKSIISSRSKNSSNTNHQIEFVRA